VRLYGVGRRASQVILALDSAFSAVLEDCHHSIARVFNVQLLTFISFVLIIGANDWYEGLVLTVSTKARCELLGQFT
jgi:hypothetical protein